MKILQIINSLNTGGAEKLIIDSVPYYNEKGVEVDIVVLKKSDSFFYKYAEENLGVKHLTINSVYNPLLIFKIIFLLRKYDIAHVHLFPSLYWVVFAKIISFSKIKLVYTEHNTNNRRRDVRLLKYLDKYIYSKLDFIGCISEATKQNLIQHLNYKKKSIEVVLNGIDLKNYKNIQKKEYNFFEDSAYILIQVSSFREQKDQKTLIKALAMLPDDIKLLLVGDGHLRKECEEFAKEIKVDHRILFLGLRADIPQLLDYARISILSSNYEGFGLSILEGMAVGKPSIASNVEGVKEIVEGYGLLFLKGDANDLKAKILKVYTDGDYAKDIAEKCKERAKQFDIAIMVYNYINVYKNLS